jgi:hypothetical protein
LSRRSRRRAEPDSSRRLPGWSSRCARGRAHSCRRPVPNPADLDSLGRACAQATVAPFGAFPQPLRQPRTKSERVPTLPEVARAGLAFMRVPKIASSLSGPGRIQTTLQIGMFSRPGKHRSLHPVAPIARFARLRVGEARPGGHAGGEPSWARASLSITCRCVPDRLRALDYRSPRYHGPLSFVGGSAEWLPAFRCIFDTARVPSVGSGQYGRRSTSVPLNRIAAGSAGIPRRSAGASRGHAQSGAGALGRAPRRARTARPVRPAPGAPRREASRRG